MDANVWLSAALRPGSTPARTLVRLLEERRAVGSAVVFEEVRRAFERAKFRRYGPEILRERFEALSEAALLLDPPPLPAPVCRDPDDDHVLALALHANAGWIVTGDRDLLVLDPWEGIRIVTPGDVE